MHLSEKRLRILQLTLLKVFLKINSLCMVVCYVVQAVSSSVFLWLSSSCAYSLLTTSCLMCLMFVFRVHQATVSLCHEFINKFTLISSHLLCNCFHSPPPSYPLEFFSFIPYKVLSQELQCVFTEGLTQGCKRHMYAWENLQIPYQFYNIACFPNIQTTPQHFA